MSRSRSPLQQVIYGVLSQPWTTRCCWFTVAQLIVCVAVVLGNVNTSVVGAMVLTLDYLGVEGGIVGDMEADNRGVNY